ncbi:MAG: HlyC/CorC family transporter [Phycisphaerae bacterium]|nr:HlyC/CorC family transporter [Phycisphaerae bacterium]
MTWLPPAISVMGLALGCLLASLRAALLTAARGAVEDEAAGRGRATAARVSRILDDLTGHARAAGAFKLLCDLAVVGAGIFWVAQERTGQADASPGVWDVTIGAALAWGAMWVFGVAVPISVAEHAGARVICTHAMLVRGMARALVPLNPVGAFIHEMVRRLAGAEVKPAAEQVQEELLSMVEEGESLGAIDERHREMIEAIMKFPTRTVEEIMTPRTDVKALEYTDNLGSVIQALKTIGHSRIPVYEDNLDHIVGVFYVKDLMKWLAGEGTHGGGKPFDLRSILRAPVVVPWSKTVRELLDEMIAKKVHVALVADEYGGTAGLVTIEDVFEEIVGDIKDEYEHGPPGAPDVVLRMEERRADVDAAARIDAVNDALSPLGVEIPESDEYDTVGGFITTTLGRIPSKGEVFTHERVVFTILEAKPTKVVKVGMEVRAPAQEGPAEAGAGDVAAAAGQP